jgi:hypothetical protein
MEIADILAQEVPDHPTYRFGDADVVRADGDVTMAPVYRDSDGEEVGSAEGASAEEIVRHGQAIAADDEAAQE